MGVTTYHGALLDETPKTDESVYRLTVCREVDGRWIGQISRESPPGPFTLVYGTTRAEALTKALEHQLLAEASAPPSHEACVASGKHGKARGPHGCCLRCGSAKF